MALGLSLALDICAAFGLPSGGALIPPANGSWSVPLWYIDPVNGVDAPSNGQARGSPLKTFAYLTGLWQTISPVLRQSTRIVFLTSQPDSTDPVLWTPVLMAGANCSIEGDTPTIVTTGVVLAGTVAKNTAVGTNALLQENLGATGAAQQMVINTTTGKSSRAFAYKSLGANAFSMTQPCAPLAVGGSPFAVTEVNTWANGDTVNLATLINVNVVLFAPTYGEFAAGFTSTGYLYQLAVPKYSSLAGQSEIGGMVRIYECVMGKILINRSGTSQLLFNPFLVNVALTGGLGGPNGFNFSAGAAYPGLTSANIVGASFQTDFIIGTSMGLLSQQTSTISGNLFLDANLTSQALLQVAGVAVYGSGSNTINMIGTARLAFTGAGTFASTFTAPGCVTGIKLNGTTTGYSQVDNPGGAGTAANIFGPIATTPANLDAAAGAAGFGGRAFNPGGASIGKAA